MSAATTTSLPIRHPTGETDLTVTRRQQGGLFDGGGVDRGT